MRRDAFLCLALAVLLVAVAASDDTAARKKRPRGCRTVTVGSNYTAGTVTGCVRKGPRGPEVQLPGGAWVPCEFGCGDTLRSRSVDFWQRFDNDLQP